MKEESASRLATMASGVTPKGISKGITNVKRGISIVKTVRKVLKVIDKYKAVIVLAVLCYWIRSAILSPLSDYHGSKKKARKQLAQKAALSLLIAPSCQSSPLSLGNICGGMVKAFGTLYLSGSGSYIDGDRETSKTDMNIEEELEQIQNQLVYIEALEVRL
jgi:hypothetical protein